MTEEEVEEHDALMAQATRRWLGILGENTRKRVYLVQCGGPSGPVKIGLTGGPMEKRMAELASGCPYPVKLLAEIPGDRELERALHRRFKADRIRGEWHRSTPALWWLVAVVHGVA